MAPVNLCPPRHSLRIALFLVDTLVLLASGLAMVALLGALFAPATSLLDLAGQFAFAAVLVLALAAIAARLRGQKRRAAAMLLIAFAGGLRVWPWPTAEACPPDAPTLRIAFHNVWVRNSDLDQTAQALAALDADVLLLSEMTPRTVEGLKTLIDAYPHRSTCGAGRACRMLLLSKMPFRDLTGETVSAFTPPSYLIADIETPAGPLRLAGIHLTRPWPFDHPDAQLHQAHGFMSALETVGGADLVLGDLNAVTWSAIPRRLAEGLDLKVLPSMGTWHRALPAPVRLPIDNILIGERIACAKKRVAPPTGSDHLPVLVDLALLPDLRLLKPPQSDSL